MSRVIGLTGTVIVLFILALTNLMLRELDESSRVANQRHVETLSKAVTYQLRTTLSAVENALDQASEDIVEHNAPERIARLGFQKQVPTGLLADLIFIDAEGQIVSALPQGKVGVHGKSTLDDLHLHFGGGHLERHIDRPVEGRPGGAEFIPMSRPVRLADGNLIGVLVGMIDVQTLNQIWGDIGLGSDDAIELVDDNDSVWLRWPHRPNRDESAERLSWSRRVPGWPLRVVAQVDLAAIDRQNFEPRRVIVVAATAGSLMTILSCILLANRARQSARDRAAGDAVRARMLAAVNAVPVEFIEYDRDRRLVLANQAARDASPWRTPGAATRKTIDEVMATYAEHFETSETAAAWRAWAEQMVADFDRGGIAESLRPDGQWRRTFVSDMPGGGRVVVRVDVTETKLQEQKLAAEMERLNSIFQSAGAGILLLDRDARVVLANQSFLVLQGKTAAEALGRPYSDLVPDGLDPAVIARWQAAAGPGRLDVVEFESTVAHSGSQTRIFQVTANPVQDERGHLRYIVLIGVDDTQRRLAEIRLFDSARLANLGEMATGMAHEINQPLAVIRLVVDSLLEVLDSADGVSMSAGLADLIKAKLGRVARQTERAAGLIDDLRAVAQNPTSDPVQFELVETARIVGNLLSEQLRAARIQFNVDPPPPGLMVHGDASRLQQVIVNVVLNARDALLGDPGASATITLGRIALRIGATPDGGAVLCIEDDGPGIPPHILPRLFEPFFTTKLAAKSTGLGLSISYDIVKSMGGEITAENRKEGGARVRISLPPVGGGNHHEQGRQEQD